MTTASTIVRSDTALDTVTHGDCIKVIGRMASAAVDFVLTDPPYIARYRSRTGQSVINDDNGAWLQPAFTQMYRLLKPGSFCVSFYGWSKADRFIAAWRSAGFRTVGHLVFRKKYASSARFLRYQHEQAYLLAKGDVTPPAAPVPDVLDWIYTGNRLHPTQKPVQVLRPLIEAFCRPASCSILSAVRARRWLPPRSSRADSSVSNSIARTISRRRGVSGNNRISDIIPQSNKQDGGCVMARLAAKLGELRKYHVGALVALVLVALSVYVALQPDINFGYSDHKQLGRRVVGFWAIMPPIVFWIDGAFFLRHVQKDRDIAMHMHDLGRNIWLALVGILAALFEFQWPS